MSGLEESLDVTYLELPSPLARELLSEGIVRPFLRQDRVDQTLLPALVIAVSSASATVVATKMTEGVARALARRIHAWRRRHDDQRDGPVTIAVQVTITEEPAVALLSRSTTEDELAQELERATARSHHQGGDDGD